MRRPPRKLLSKLTQINAVIPFERGFADLMLFAMMVAAEADRPSVGWLERDASVGVTPHMGAFDGTIVAAWHTALMAAHPRTMNRAFAAVRLAQSLALKPVREPQPGHVWLAPSF